MMTTRWPCGSRPTAHTYRRWRIGCSARAAKPTSKSTTWLVSRRARALFRFVVDEARIVEVELIADSLTIAALELTVLSD